jgi:L-fuculose-phosphate aldolase
MNEQDVRKELAEVGRMLWNRHYIVAGDGNLSARLEDGSIITTPSGVCKGFLTPDSFCRVDIDGKKLAGKLNPSTEFAMHSLIYKERPDINAVVHAHPPTGTGFAVAGIPLDKALISEVVLTLGCIPLAGYGTPSTSELTDAMKPLVKHHDAMLMANHGAVAYGDTIERAFWRMETLEHFAKINLVAKMLGRENQLSAEEVQRLYAVRERGGLMPESARVCQVCSFTHAHGASCPTGSGGGATSVTNAMSGMGDEKITMTRNELVNLITEAARMMK